MPGVVRCLILAVLLRGAFSAGEVSFTKQIGPILQAKCLGCHDAEKAKGGYRLHTFDAFLKPGKSAGPAIVPGDAAKSEVFKRITTTDPDERMPQKDEPLTSEQIEYFRNWITAGAKLDLGSGTNLISLLLRPSSNALPPESYRRPLPILSLAFSPDGRQLATGGDHEITLWTLEGRLAARLTNVVKRTRAIAFHPTEPFLAIGGGQPGRHGAMAIYDFNSRMRERVLFETSDEVLFAAFSSDGNSLACSGTDNCIRIFDWETRELRVTIQQHADWVTSLCWHTNNTQIASVSRDRTARVYDATSGNLEATYTSQNVPLTVVAFVEDGRIISGGRDKALHFWEIKDGKKKADISGLTGEPYTLVVSGGSLFVAGGNGFVRKYSSTDRKQLLAFEGHSETVYSLALHDESKRLATGSHDGTVNLWDSETGKLIRTFTAAPGWTPLH